jgi:NitT/TauT family transport system ATP-binding protein
VSRLVRAHQRAAEFVDDARNREEVAALLAAPNRIGIDADVIRRTIDGRLKVSPEGAIRSDPNHLIVGRAGASRPDPAQAAWLYAQMVRWGQAPLSREMLAAASAVFGPDLYDAAFDKLVTASADAPADGIGAFTGPAFDFDNIAAYLAAWTIKRESGG